MTRTVTGFCMVIALGISTGAMAQRPDANGPARNDGVTTPGDFEQAKGAKSTDTFTLTGCMDRANDGTYELRDARMSSLGTDTTQGTPGATGGAVGTSGATSASKAPVDQTPSTWILKSTTDLSPHVGHSVQITGRVSAPSGTGGSETATTSSPTTTATGARMKQSGEEAHSVDVQSVRMISRSCS
jgi:hypothetical protein